ncbi:sigma-54 dependent transcriptional regulator [uncultured Shewanella sp.]|uniref:sigma-54-dependent transcriptional regulator n=1 Tax=uncultured Shewanella sp. TaxID=173975 RepID=UPI002616B7B9|nr:sigma-54 dependent transcriptional regulator [uncultured Shewanella sp.]
MDVKESFSALLIEDSMSLGALYTEYLKAEGARVTHVNYGSDALHELEQWQPDLLVLDIQLPDMSGMDILTHVREQYEHITVIMITAHATVDLAVEAMKAGAFDFLIKPFDAKRLSFIVRHALEHRQLINLVSTYENSLPKVHYMGFIGDSLLMQAVYRTIGNVANSKASVFIIGESGTGKEVCAQAVHQAGHRKNEAFVALNCASIPKDLMESEIFGHRKGAFTGAISHRDGAASRAHKGTLFLDEICEMDLELQSKLLRFIQTGVFQRVGGVKEEVVDVRFVSATNRVPWEEVKAGRFREDLFYRLHVIPIDLPPLRERGDDVTLISNHFIKEYNNEEGKCFRGFTPDVESLFKEYDWPGNIRQLQNVIRQMVVLNQGSLIDETMLPCELSQVKQSLVERGIKPLTRLDMKNSLESNLTLLSIDEQTDSHAKGDHQVQPLWVSEKRTIEAAVALCDGNVPKAAALLEISASTIYRKKQMWDEQKNNPCH